MPLRVACVVEGHGDVEAVPIVLRRIAADIQPPVDIRVSHPIRTPKSKLLVQGELERAVELALRTIGGRGAVFVLLDSDDDCPADAGPRLLSRVAGRQESQLHISVVLAKYEFENWFIAAAESLAGVSGLSQDLRSPPDPEAVRGAKEWLTRGMASSRCYSPALDQPALSDAFSLELAAARSPSFDKFCRDVRRILVL